MAGHLRNITITANEALKTANVTVFGITSVMIVNGTTASANVTVDENSTEGVVSFNITAFDLAGNSLTVNQTHLNSPNITIDQTNPTLSNLTIYSNNHKPHLLCNSGATHLLHSQLLQILALERNVTVCSNRDV